MASTVRARDPWTSRPHPQPAVECRKRGCLRAVYDQDSKLCKRHHDEAWYRGELPKIRAAERRTPEPLPAVVTTKKRHTREVRGAAVRRADQVGAVVAADEFDVSAASIYNWRKQGYGRESA